MEESFQKVMRIIPETIVPQRRAMHLLPSSSSTVRRRAPSLHPWLAAALAGACAAAGVQAQPAATENTADTPALGTVVVTASGREQQVKEAPASISVITREELDQRPYATLQDVMKDLEGVSVVGASANEKDIVIRGMPGEYTLILVDGRRQGTRETMNRGTAGVQSNLIPPLAAIERIEVVRGPMSSLYGADAMGGVINIITRKVPKQWSGSLEVGGIWQQDRDQGDSTLADFWIGGPLRDGVLGVQVFGKSRHRGEDDIFFPLNATSGNFGNRDEEPDGQVHPETLGRPGGPSRPARAASRKRARPAARSRPPPLRPPWCAPNTSGATGRSPMTAAGISAPPPSRSTRRSASRRSGARAAATRWRQN